MVLSVAFVPAGNPGSQALLRATPRQLLAQCPRRSRVHRRASPAPAWAMAARAPRQRSASLIRSFKVGLVGVAALFGAVLAGPTRVRAAASTAAPQQTSAVVIDAARAPGRRLRPGELAAATATTANTTPRKINTEKELSDKERLVSMGMTAAATGGLFFWAFQRNRKDDVDEAVRIKNEVDRLEKWKKEFLDVEEGDESIPDEEMMDELRKRMGLPEPENVDGTDNDDEGKISDPEAKSDKDRSTTSATAAGTDAPTVSGSDQPAASDSAHPGDEEDPDVSQEKLDMLRRMFDGSDENKDKTDEGDRPSGTSGPPSAVLERPDENDASKPKGDSSESESPPSEQVDFLKRMWDADSTNKEDK